jgi:peptidoglycan/LPS O-acetylase OafA/YrhL
MDHSVGDQFEPINFKTRFPALDGIRALAVTMVFALHFGAGSHGPILRAIKAISRHGGMGVDLFFVLSGFLITGILYDTRADSHYFSRFFGRRSIRIFPVFYFALALLLALTPLLGYQWKPGHLAFPFYMGNFAMALDPSLRNLESKFHPAASAALIHFWSLCVEEQFYLIWPLLVWVIRERVRLIFTATVLSLVALGLRIVFLRTISPDYDEMWMQHLLPFRMDSLLIGAILALVLRGPASGWWQRTCRLILVGGTAVVFGILVASPSPTSVWYNSVGLSMVAITCAGLIGTVLDTRSRVSRLFQLGPLRTLGKYSYGFYVYHLIWAAAWNLLVLRLTLILHSSPLATVLVDVLCFATTFMVAKLSFDQFECRFLCWKGRFAYDSERSSHRNV